MGEYADYEIDRFIGEDDDVPLFYRRSRPPKRFVKLEGVDLIRETEKAILVLYEGVEGWLPKSEIKWRVSDRVSSLVDIVMPQWLYEDKWSQ